GGSHALAQGHRAANDHEEVVGIRLFVGHHELEMDPEELPAKPLVMFGLDDVAETHRRDLGVASVGAGIDAVTLDRIELVEIHHVLARLAVDPVDRRLHRELPEMIAEILRGGVEPDDREISANRQQYDARAVPPQSGIEFQCPRQHFGAEKRSRTVADDDDFLGVAAAGDINEMLGKAVDTLVPFGTFAVRELPSPDRVAQEIEHISAVFGVFQHGTEQRYENGCRRRNAERGGNADGVQGFSNTKAIAPAQIA